MRNRHHRFERRLAIELDDALANVLGQIGDAFQLGRDLHDGGHKAQVDGRRLHLRDELQRPAIDLQLHLIDAAVVADDLLGERRVALEKRANRLRDRVLDHGAHPQKKIFELFDIVIEMSLHRPIRIFPSRNLRSSSLSGS